MLVFTKHALDKFSLLEQHNCYISHDDVAATIEHPDFIDHARSPLFIAQRTLDESHALRVVYKKELNRKIIITFYPVQTKRYEKKS